MSFLIEFEEEEFTFGTDVESVAHLLCLVDDFLEDVSRIALERGLVVGHIDGADQTACLDLLVLSPGNDCPGIVIGMQVHITFIDPNEPVDGRTVKHAFIIQGFFQLRYRDGNVFHDTEQVGELQSHEFDIVLFCTFQDLFFCELTHKNLPFR